MRRLIVLSIIGLGACFDPQTVTEPSDTDASPTTTTSAGSSGSAPSSLGSSVSPSDSSTGSPGTATGIDSAQDSTSPSTSDSTISPTDPSSGPGCEPGLMDCGSGECDVDTSRDSSNCGACGHDCLGGTCTQGTCEPVALHFNSQVQSMVADEGYLYFTTPTSLERIEQNEVLVSEPLIAKFGNPGSGPPSVAADAMYAYVAGGSNATNAYLLRVPKVGGPVLDLFATARGFLFAPRNLALSPSRVIWSSSNPLIASNSVHSTPKDGGTITDHLVDGDPALVQTIAGNSTHAFWTQTGNVSALRTRSFTIGGTQTVFEGLTSCNGLIATNRALFWAGVEAGTGLSTLWSADANGTNRHVLLDANDDHFDDGYGLLLHGDTLFWGDVEDDDNYLRSISTDGSGARTLLTGVLGLNNLNQYDEGSLAIDSDAYFYYSDSQIWRLAR